MQNFQFHCRCTACFCYYAMANESFPRRCVPCFLVHQQPSAIFVVVGVDNVVPLSFDTQSTRKRSLAKVKCSSFPCSSTAFKSLNYSWEIETANTDTEFLVFLVIDIVIVVVVLISKLICSLPHSSLTSNSLVLSSNLSNIPWRLTPLTNIAVLGHCCHYNCFCCYCCFCCRCFCCCGCMCFCCSSSR